MSALDADDAAVAFAALYSLRCAQRHSVQPGAEAILDAAAIKRMQDDELKRLGDEIAKDSNKENIYEVAQFSNFQCDLSTLREECKRYDLDQSITYIQGAS